MTEVLGASLCEQIVAVVIRPAWGLNWAIWTASLSTPIRIVDNLHFVDMLAWIAVPKGILAIMLPPFSFKTSYRAFWVNFRSWASSFDLGESKALVFHGAAHEIVNLWSLVCERAFSGAVLVLKLHVTGIVVIERIASLLTN